MRDPTAAATFKTDQAMTTLPTLPTLPLQPTSSELPAVDANGLPIIRILGLQPTWLKTRREEALEPDLAIVDAHHHLWDRAGGYLLDELLADLGDLDDPATGHNVVATVYLQCAYAYRSTGPVSLRPVGETEFVADIARQAEQRGVKTKVCAGIVGYADLELGDAVDAVLQAHIDAGDGRFRGIRHILARHDAFNASLLGPAPVDLMQRVSFRRGLARLQALGLSFDAWLFHTQIDELVDLAQALPGLPIVLNHAGGPLAVGPYTGKRDEVFVVWREAIKRLAACPNVSIKLGGLGMAIGGFEFHKQALPPSSEQLAAAWAPYMHACIESFGAQRCMFESNFPVDKASCSYGVLWNAYKRIAAGASPAEKAWLFKDSACTFYRLGVDSCA